jgi:hypothetical protein
MGPFGVRAAAAESVGNSVVIEQPEVAVQPRFAPPLAPEAVTLACPGQVVPHLLFHPVSDVREAVTRVPYRRVLHPTPQNGIDARNHLCDWPGPMTPEDLSLPKTPYILWPLSLPVSADNVTRHVPKRDRPPCGDSGRRPHGLFEHRQQ